MSAQLRLAEAVCSLVSRALGIRRGPVEDPMVALHFLEEELAIRAHKIADLERVAGQRRIALQDQLPILAATVAAGFIAHRPMVDFELTRRAVAIAREILAESEREVDSP